MSADPWEQAETTGVALVRYGIELSKGAGFTPPEGVSSDDQAKAILKDAIPRVMGELKRDGFL